jgi:hypothetical protein
MVRSRHLDRETLNAQLSTLKKPSELLARTARPCRRRRFSQLRILSVEHFRRGFRVHVLPLVGIHAAWTSRHCRDTPVLLNRRNRIDARGAQRRDETRKRGDDAEQKDDGGIDDGIEWRHVE